MECLEAKAYELRKDVLDMVCRAKTGHIGGDFSVMEILVTLYYRVMNLFPENWDSPHRDHFVLSKGHSVEALYAILADRGFFPKEELLTYSQFGSCFIGHPNNKLPGIEMNSGSLGHGLPVSVGMALACRMDKVNSRVYTVMGDGELAEGSVWEGAMAAGHYALNNLCAVVDRNRLQISGPTEDVMSEARLDDRFESFGWNVLHAAGNNIAALTDAFQAAEETLDRPTLIIADTVKGCGVSFMEGQAGWHHRIPTEAEYDQAVEELARRRQEAK